MVKRIANWTLGGFFRTLGRFLAFLGISILFLLIFKKNDIKITSLLGIEYVKADTITPWNTIQVRFAEDDHGTDTWTSYYTATNYTYTPTYPLKSIQWRLTASSSLSRENTYTFDFAYRPTPDSISVSSYYISTGGASDKEDITCEITTGSTGFVHYNCTFTPRNTISSGSYLYARLIFNSAYLTQVETRMTGYEERKGTNAIITEQTNNIINQMQTNMTDIQNFFQQNGQVIQDAVNGLKEQQSEEQQVCATTIIDKENIIIENKYLESNGTLANSGVGNGVTDFIEIGTNTKIIFITSHSGENLCFYDEDKTFISYAKERDNVTIPNNAKYVRFTISKPENRPQVELYTCKNGNQALSDTLNDDNVDSESNDMGDFLNDYEFSNDSTISSLLTLPITFLENVLTTSSNADLCATYKSKNICLPSGNLVWGRNDITAFKTFFNLLVGGYLSYKMLRSFVRTSESALDPNNHKVEVMRL